MERINPTDIDEIFLRKIEDTGIRFQNTSLEEATCLTLQPPQKFAVPPPALQFIDVPVALDDNL